MNLEWNKYVAIIDGDSIIYTFSYVYRQEENMNIVYSHIDKYLNKILDSCNTDKYVLCIEGLGNFRKNILHISKKKYKEGRKEKPDLYNNIKSHLLSYWKAEESVNIETDDFVTILSTNVDLKEEFLYTILCAVDKDLKQVPILQYNYKKNTFHYFSKDESLYNLWLQMLIGDSVDNIEGIKGIGEYKAHLILNNKNINEQIPGLVFQCYWDYWVNLHHSTWNVPIIEFCSNFMKLYMLQYHSNRNINLPKIRNRKDISF